MSQAIVKQEKKELWNQEDVDLIRQIAAKNASDAEFKLLLYLAGKYQLDPLARQIWCVKYGNEAAQIYAGRDGFLKIAHDSGLFDGMDSEEIFDDRGNLLGATCIVWRKDMTHPFKTRVSFKEYNTGKSQWLAKPGTMIKKVAEAQCLRKAFPVSGLYTPEEVAEFADEPAPQRVEVNPVRQAIVVDTSTGEIVEQPKRGKKMSDMEIFEQGRIAKYIWETTGLETVPKGNHVFANITLDQFGGAVKGITGTNNSVEALKKYGIQGTLNDILKAKYKGEGLSMGQMLSAGLHYLWEQEQLHKDKLDTVGELVPAGVTVNADEESEGLKFGF